MRILIDGSEYLRDYDKFVRKCDRILSRMDSPVILSAGHGQRDGDKVYRGAGVFADKYAEDRGLEVVRFDCMPGDKLPVNLDNVDAAILFFGKWDNRTFQIRDEAAQVGVRCRVVGVT